MLAFVSPAIPSDLMGYVSGTLLAVFYANTVGVSLFDIALARFFAGECLLWGVLLARFATKGNRNEPALRALPALKTCRYCCDVYSGSCGVPE